MKKAYLIAKVLNRHATDIIVCYFKKISDKTYENYDDAKSALEVMDDDGIFTIIECFIKENSR